MVERVSSKPVEDRVKPIPKPETGTATVVVGCKYPNGIVMRQFRMVEKRRLVSGLPFTENMAEETGKRFTIRGPAFPYGHLPNIQVVGGYALTVGVPRDLCETWFEQNKDSDLVQNELIFWEPDTDRAVSHAQSLRSTRSGLEALDPTKPVPGLSGITKADLTDNDMLKNISSS